MTVCSGLLLLDFFFHKNIIVRQVQSQVCNNKNLNDSCYFGSGAVIECQYTKMLTSGLWTNLWHRHFRLMFRCVPQVHHASS